MTKRLKLVKRDFSLKDFWRLFKKSLIQKGIFEPNGRQPYFVGKLRIGTSFEELRKRLELFGFQMPKLEWRDIGQIFSARLEDGKFQYHLRIFKDGEVRGHLELRPKYVIRHLAARTRQPCPSFFLILLNEFLIQ